MAAVGPKKAGGVGEQARTLTGSSDVAVAGPTLAGGGGGAGDLARVLCGLPQLQRMNGVDLEALLRAVSESGGVVDLSTRPLGPLGVAYVAMRLAQGGKLGDVRVLNLTGVCVWGGAGGCVGVHLTGV